MVYWGWKDAMELPQTMALFFSLHWVAVIPHIEGILILNQEVRLDRCWFRHYQKSCSTYTLRPSHFVLKSHTDTCSVCEAAGASLMGWIAPDCITFFSLPHSSSCLTHCLTPGNSSPVKSLVIHQMPNRIYFPHTCGSADLTVSLCPWLRPQVFWDQENRPSKAADCLHIYIHRKTAEPWERAGLATALPESKSGEVKERGRTGGSFDTSACSCLPRDWTNNCLRKRLCLPLLWWQLIPSISPFTWLYLRCGHGKWS